MPFTFSHPALIVPVLRLRPRYPWLSATGLITGSIAPDFEKFFRLKLASSYSHTVPSIFYFSCPVSLALAFLFHLVVRPPLLAHLPGPLHQRLGRFRQFDWLWFFRRHHWGVVASIVLGAALHLLWDSFTHANAFMARVWPGINEPIWLGNHARPLFELLAAVSTVAGGLFIVRAVWQMPRQPVGPAPSTAALRRYWGIAGLVAGALLTEWVLAVDPRFLEGSIAAISASLVGVLAASLYTRRKSQVRQRPA